MSDEICVMREGRVIEQGRSSDVLQNPGEPFTRALIDAAHLL
jgi:ABC-type microcin C transport system duplicated ATPase subunit YejF